MRRAGTLALLLTVLGTAAPAGSSSLALVGPDAAIRTQHQTSFVGNGIYTSGGRNQTVFADVAPGRTRTFVVRVENDGSSAADSFMLLGSAGGGTFGIAYLEGLEGSADVTAEVVAGTYTMNDVERGRHRIVRIVLTAAEGAPTGAYRSVLLTATSVERSYLSDTVRARVVVPPLRTSAVSADGRFRCTASFPDRVLDPGYETQVRFTLTNLTNQTASPRYGVGYGSLIFRDELGNELWSTRPFWEGPTPWVGSIEPHGTKKLWAFDARVRWSAPLTIEPVCTAIRAHLPPVTLDVAVPGETPRPDAAIDAAVAVTHGVFDSCRPIDRTHAVTGEFPPPDGSALAPLPMRCWANVEREEGFDVVTLFFVSPADAQLKEPPLPGDPWGLVRWRDDLPPWEVARFDFVVTTNEVRGFASARISRTPPADGRAPSFEWWDGTWYRGWGTCGYWGWAIGITIAYYNIDWVTSCPLPEGATIEELGDTPLIVTVALPGQTPAIRRITFPIAEKSSRP